MATSDIYRRTFDEDSQTTNCPECGGSVVTNTRETCCDDCGLVIAESPIDRGPEWRSFDDDDTRRRVGAPRTPARHDRGLSTVIGRHRDGQGNQLAGKRKRRLGRLRREHARAKQPQKVDRNQAYGMTDIRRLVSALDLSRSVRDRACTLFREAQNAGLFRGRSLDAFAAACVYAACRCLELPRTKAEVEPFARCDRSALRNAFSVLNVELGLEILPLSPTAFVPRVASGVNVDAATQTAAMELAEYAEANGLTHGRNPFGVAAACVAIVTGTAVTQQELANIADVTPVTIRSSRERIQAERPEAFVDD